MVVKMSSPGRSFGGVRVRKTVRSVGEEVNARVTNTGPPPVMQLVIVDPVKVGSQFDPAVEAYEREQGLAQIEES